MPKVLSTKALFLDPTPVVLDAGFFHTVGYDHIMPRNGVMTQSIQLILNHHWLSFVFAFGVLIYWCYVVTNETC